MGIAATASVLFAIGIAEALTIMYRHRTAVGRSVLHSNIACGMTTSLRWAFLVTGVFSAMAADTSALTAAALGLPYVTATVIGNYVAHRFAERAREVSDAQ